MLQEISHTEKYKYESSHICRGQNVCLIEVEGRTVDTEVQLDKMECFKYFKAQGKNSW
jgi:hypothetical protein